MPLRLSAKNPETKSALSPMARSSRARSGREALRARARRAGPAASRRSRVGAGAARRDAAGEQVDEVVLGEGGGATFWCSMALSSCSRKNSIGVSSCTSFIAMRAPPGPRPQAARFAGNVLAVDLLDRYPVRAARPAGCGYGRRRCVISVAPSAVTGSVTARHDVSAPAPFSRMADPRGGSRAAPPRRCGCPRPRGAGRWAGTAPRRRA